MIIEELRPTATLHFQISGGDKAKTYTVSSKSLMVTFWTDDGQGGYT
jgi:hypothetical protein